MALRFSLIPLLLLLYSTATGQTIRGTVTDKVTGQPLVGATVVLPELQPQLGTVTNASGYFRLEPVPVGRQLLRISYLGYAEYVLTDLLVTTGKETVLQVALAPVAGALAEVEVTPDARSLATLNPLSTRTFTVEETQRYAAAFYDPARLATSYPGVVNADDQANHLIVRGNSPAGVQWRLEGVNIVNPNHQPNAGTFSDRAAPTGGGVNILSAQLLSDSRFMAGAYGPGYGNALAGIFDMRLRNGNNEKREHTLQASLLGIDLATEGPLNKSKGSSYLVNYRYSTVGLLSILGVQFGNEDIQFQDLSYHLVLPAGKAGNFTLFGLGGLSSNRFTSPEETSTWEVEKDRYNINFKSWMFAQGLTHELQLGTRTRLRTSAVYSALEDDRQAQLVVAAPPLPATTSDYHRQALLSFSTSVEHRVSRLLQLQAGIMGDARTVRLESEATGQLPLVDGGLAYQLWQPFVNASMQLSPRLSAQAGLHHIYYSRNGQQLTEPRASLRYRFASGNSFSLAAGLYSQAQQPAVLLATRYSAIGLAELPNRNLGLSRSQQYVLGYTHRLPAAWLLRTEAYYQYLFQIPVSTRGGSFSTLNLLDEYVQEELVNEGKGRNYGMELSVEKPLLDKYYLLASGTLFNSMYSIPAAAAWSTTRFNGRYAFSFTGGRETEWNRNDKKRTFGIHLRGVYRGGLNEMPIDEAASITAQRTQYRQEAGYSQQLPGYYRLDLRLSISTNKQNSTRTLALDLQNMTSRENVAYRYYDALQGQIIDRNQLGIIPVLSYRVEF